MQRDGSFVFLVRHVGEEWCIMSNKISLRVNPRNPNHHLWNNNGTWWCHYTIHLPDYTKQRVRRSLRTDRLPEARSLRNRILTHSEALE
jgi:hypothetical protein